MVRYLGQKQVKGGEDGALIRAFVAGTRPRKAASVESQLRVILLRLVTVSDSFSLNGDILAFGTGGLG